MGRKIPNLFYSSKLFVNCRKVPQKAKMATKSAVGNGSRANIREYFFDQNFDCE